MNTGMLGAQMSPATPPGPNLAPPPAGPAAVQARLLASHNQAKAQFDKTADLVKRADNSRVGLQRLTQLGDTITPDDVVHEAGKLVSKGEDPLVLAGLLAQMPVDGPPAALAGWVAAHAQQAAQTEAKIAQAHEAAKHALGVTGLHVLQAARMTPGAMVPQVIPGPASGPNPLMGAQSNAN